MAEQELGGLRTGDVTDSLRYRNVALHAAALRSSVRHASSVIRFAIQCDILIFQGTRPARPGIFQDRGIVRWLISGAISAAAADSEWRVLHAQAACAGLS